MTASVWSHWSSLAARIMAEVTGKTASRRRWSLRGWSVRHARGLEWFYERFARLLLLLHPLLHALGYQRLEKPARFAERQVKGLLFDCRMCGQCILSSTGMSCPMTCPKQLRNGPCGGVRANGNCEVEPDMPCVWVKAWEGAQTMRGGAAINIVQKPADRTLEGSSAWLRVTAQAAEQRENLRIREPV